MNDRPEFFNKIAPKRTLSVVSIFAVGYERSLLTHHADCTAAFTFDRRMKNRPP